MKKIVIAGGGGFAKEVRAILERMNQKEQIWEFAGYVVNDRDGEEIFGNDEKLVSADESLHVVIALGKPKQREKLYKMYRKNPKLQFPNIIDPSVQMMSEVKIGKGTIICPNVVLTVDIEIGDFCLINMGCTIAHDDLLESFVSVNPGCNLSGNVKLGSLTEVGTGSTIVEGIAIGKEVDIWTGSAVIKSIPDKCIVVGTPAKIVRHKS